MSTKKTRNFYDNFYRFCNVRVIAQFFFSFGTRSGAAVVFWLTVDIYEFGLETCKPRDSCVESSLSIMELGEGNERLHEEGKSVSCWISGSISAGSGPRDSAINHKNTS